VHNAEIRATGLTTYEIDPLTDPRWADFLERHPHASVFHSPNWLEALKRTYGYEPVVYTTSPSGVELRNGWAFCCINSWLTGHRLVSLPFSDHCRPLVPDLRDLDCLARALRQNQQRRKWKYIEFRSPVAEPVVPGGFEASAAFCLHRLDLHPALGELFQNLHKDSTQRKIRRAEREGLICEEGRSEEFLERFYRLLVLTRRRHHVPAQPRKWFSNLIACLGDRANIRIASRQGQPLAGIFTLRFRDTLVYKYGGSDSRFQNLGGMHLCLWRAIEEAKATGLKEFDLGRSDSDDHGLIVFKNRWGAHCSSITYFRRWLQTPHTGAPAWQTPLAKQALTHMPDIFLSTAGRLLYRHLG
jgi:hypothetical protein